MIKNLILSFGLMLGANTLLFSQPSTSVFAQEMQTLKMQFAIKQWAYIVKKGDSILYQTPDIDSNTLLFPIASLTKIFAGTLLMQFVENQQLSLEDDVIKYLPNLSAYSTIKVKHLLSHTSQGEVGETFYYSNSRYALLGKILEKISGKTFETLLQEHILKPARMQDTFLLKDSLQTQKWGSKIAKGKYEYGFSASGGMVSCAEDLMRFDDFLNQNVSENARKLMFQPFYANAPYGLGIFTQKIAGKSVVWGYGQASSFSSLYIRILEDNLTFIFLANNNSVNNYPKLINGDLTTSLFALCFLKYFVFMKDKNKGLENEKYFANALNESGFSNYGNAIKNLKLLNKKSLFSISGLYLLYTLKLKTRTNSFDKIIEKVSKKLLKEDEQNPYVHFYLGNYYDLNGNTDKTRYHFNLLKNLPNFDRNWYTEEAENYFKTLRN
jgi:hypothetical protein